MNIRLTLCLAAMAALCALLLILPVEAVTPLAPSGGLWQASVTPSPWRQLGGGAPMQYRGPGLAAADTPTSTSTFTPSPTPTPCKDAYEPDDMIPSAIGAGETQNRTFCPGGDVDLVTCLAKAGHAYRVYTSNLSPGTDTELTVTVPGIPDPLYNDDRQPMDLSSFIEFVTPLGPDVTFLIAVGSRGPYGPAYSYQLSVQQYVPTPTITPTPDLRDAYEPDETTPTQIIVGTTQRHNFFPFGDIDYVWFHAGAGRLYRVSTTGVDTMLISSLVELPPPKGSGEVSPAGYREVIIRVPADRDMKAMIEIRSQGQYGGDQVYDLTVEEIPLTATPTFTPEPTLYGTPCWLPLALRPAPTPTPTITRTPTQNPYPVPTATITATPSRTLSPTRFPTFTPTLSPTPQPTPINCYEALRNTSFESDEAWQRGSSPHPAAYTTVVALSGSRAMRLGIEPWSANQESYSSISQSFTIPANAASATLRYWVWRHTEETPTWAKPWPGSAGLPTPPTLATGPAPDVQAVMLWDGARYVSLLKTKTNDEIWVQITHDLTPWRGRQLAIYFNANNDGLDGKTWMYLDDVTIQVCLPAGLAE